MLHSFAATKYTKLIHISINSAVTVFFLLVFHFVAAVLRHDHEAALVHLVHLLLQHQFEDAVFQL